MKFFSYIGTRNKQSSNTLKLLSFYIDEVKKQNPTMDISMASYSASDFQILCCKGCVTCFNKGFCPLDKIDSFKKVKDDIISSDVVILGSPVYAASVSGDMKIFIDRLSYWLHLMPLTGKIGVMLITASGNSVIETSSYLNRIMESWGLAVVSNLLCTVDSPKMLNSPQFKEITIPQHVDILSKYMYGKPITPSAYQEKYFKVLQSTYDMPTAIDNAEVVYWKENGMLSYKNYTDYLDSIKSIKRSILDAN